VADWKYHVTSLVAVFLALGIGIVVGSMVIGDQAVVSQQSSMLARLERDLAALRQSNEQFRLETAAARQSVAESRAVARNMLPTLVAGRLKGVSVALVGDGRATTTELSEMLTQAGARVVSTTGIHLDDFPWSDMPALLGVMAKSVPGTPVPDLFGQRLGEAVARGVDGGLIEEGIKQGWLKCTGEYGRGNSSLVILDCGYEANPAAANAFLSLARYWREKWGPVVVATPDKAATRTYRKLADVTVGDVTDPLIQAAIVAALVPDAATEASSRQHFPTLDYRLGN
jgi:uncharacterized membrane protein YciS (DUF1049 family)